MPKRLGTTALEHFYIASNIKDGENGFLANELEWFTKLEYIYLNRDKLNGIIKNPRNYSIEKYRNKNQLKGLEELYTKMIEK